MCICLIRLTRSRKRSTGSGSRRKKLKVIWRSLNYMGIRWGPACATELEVLELDLRWIMQSEIFKTIVLPLIMRGWIWSKESLRLRKRLWHSKECSNRRMKFRQIAQRPNTISKCQSTSRDQRVLTPIVVQILRVINNNSAKALKSNKSLRGQTKTCQ